MADVLHFWTFLVICVASVTAGVLTAKGYYCRDPDTGKLYPVNTTWSSTSFCGKYTCRIRKLNNTNVIPLKQINITSFHVDNSTFIPYKDLKEDPEINDKNGTKSQTRGYYVSITNNTIATTENTTEAAEKYTIDDVREESQSDDNNSSSELLNTKGEYQGYSASPIVIPDNEPIPQIPKDNLIQNMRKLALNADNDRYLTQDEIKNFTKILQNFKKSDLEAILEIYNLAQQIYKELDSNTDETFIEEMINELKKELNLKVNIMESPRTNGSKTSFWYEPLGIPSKNKPDPHGGQGIVPYDMGKAVKSSIDTSIEGTFVMPVTVAPPKDCKKKSNLDLFPLSRALNVDAKQVPYYFPITDFQRLNSYLQPSRKSNAKMLLSNAPMYPQSKIPKPMPAPRVNNPPRVPINNNFLFYQYLDPPATWLKSTKINKNMKTINNHLERDVRFKPALMQPYPPIPIPYQPIPIPYQPIPYPMPVPYPMYVQSLQNNTRPQMHSNVLTPTNNQERMINAGNKPNVPVKNWEPTKQKQNLPKNQQSKLMSKGDKGLPDWQTEQLSESVLNDLKANVITKSKILPYLMRKKVKVERVGKVIKLNDLTRSKRDIDKSYKHLSPSHVKNTSNGDAKTRSKEHVKNISKENVKNISKEHVKNISKGHVKRNEKNRNVRGENNFGIKDVFRIYETYIERSSCSTGIEPGFFRLGNLTKPFPACCPERIVRNR